VCSEAKDFLKIVYLYVSAVYTYRGSSVGHSDCERFDRLVARKSSYICFKKE